MNFVHNFPILSKDEQSATAEVTDRVSPPKERKFKTVHDADLPSWVLCSITHSVMRSPIQLPSGHWVDETTVESWRKANLTWSKGTGFFVFVFDLCLVWMNLNPQKRCNRSVYWSQIDKSTWCRLKILTF